MTAKSRHAGAFPMIASLLALSAFPAAAVTFTAPDGATLTFYGQLGAAVQSYNDGTHNYNSAGDNANSTSRIGLTYGRQLGSGRLEFHLETALGAVLTKSYNQTNGNPGTFKWDKKQLRKLEVTYANSFGTISAGQGSMATDGAGNVDDSGTAIAGYAGWDDLSGGYFLRKSDGTLSTIRLGSAFRNTDGPRRFRLRYDTPSYQGFSLAVAYGKEVLDASNHNRYYDTALRWKGIIAGMTVDGALGYAWTKPRSGATVGNSVVSVSITHPSGANLTLAGGNVQHGGQWDYAKLGYGHKWFALGKTAVAAEYFHSNGFGSSSGHARGWGLMATQVLEKYNVTLYAGYRHQQYSDASASYLPAKTYTVGAFWTF